MKGLTYSFFGAILGLILGVFFGSIFDMAYTKKSQREDKAIIQAFIFGGIGGFSGLIYGSKIATEERLEKIRNKKYIESLTKQSCLKCSETFEYSKLLYNDKTFCEPCEIIMENNYKESITEILKNLKGIEELKRISAIENRISKIRTLTESILFAEDCDLDFVYIKPSELYNRIDEIERKIIILKQHMNKI